MYFITICTKDRESFLGKIEMREMILNEYGRIIEQCWFDLVNHYHNLQLGAFVIMPNHIHGIMIIDNSRETTDRVDGCGVVPPRNPVHDPVTTPITPIEPPSWYL